MIDSGWYSQNRSAYTSPVEQCRAKYLLHLRGNGYSAGLKYKLACGSLVVRMRSEPYDEFFYHALTEGVHYVAVDLPPVEYVSAADRSVGINAVERVTVSQLEALFTGNSASRRAHALRGSFNHSGLLSVEGQLRAQQIADAGRAFVRDHLSTRALNCYWLLALEQYSRIYFYDASWQYV